MIARTGGRVSEQRPKAVRVMESEWKVAVHRTEDVLKALEFAAMAHRGQVRDGAEGVPFLQHPCDVVSILRGSFAPRMLGNEVYVVAFLHDVIEDTPYGYREIAREFSEDIARDVQLLTTDPHVKGTAKTDHQIGVMLRAETSDLVRCVKLADKIANLRDLKRYAPDWPEDRIARFKARSLLVGSAALERARNRSNVEGLYASLIEAHAAFSDR